MCLVKLYSTENVIVHWIVGYWMMHIHGKVGVDKVHSQKKKSAVIVPLGVQQLVTGEVPIKVFFLTLITPKMYMYP